MSDREEVIVTGSGLVGIATAYQLAVRCAPARVILIADRDPVRDRIPAELDCYSVWCPNLDEQMLRLVGRNVDLLEQLSDRSDDSFAMNRRGQLLVTDRADTLAGLRVAAGRLASTGHGPLREHSKIDWYLPSPASGFRGVADGFDLLEGPDAVRAAFPFVAPGVAGALHVRRAGWVNGAALRRWLLLQARYHGVEILHDGLVGIKPAGERGPIVSLASGTSIEAAAIIACPERRTRGVLTLIGTPLPLWDAPYLRGRLEQGDRILPQSAPLVTGLDRAGGALHARPAADHSLIVAWGAETPAGGGDEIAGGTGAALLAVLAEVVPAAATHRGPSSALRTDSSMLARTSDLRPIIGPIAPGILLNAGHDRPVSTALAAGDLIAKYIFAESLPDLAGAFTADRLSEPVGAGGWRRSSRF